ncbi:MULTISPECIES: flavodoxin [unclassified Faecalibacillus]|uniref:flavodoxin n=1 Tax=unclassified Faecalibacillus TaxID=2678890 RepID=UPI001D0B9891|nr:MULTISPECIES: flavodoxin [unclassified Faecalibacillus]MCB8540727.1 flavodoxin [Faecalibacillus sp. TM498]MCB8558412.1 flavodoxin [Faecalibacillus sp. TM111]
MYFSWFGSTQNIAKEIQKQTNSDIFEIVPEVAYSDDYDTVVDDVKKEQQEKARPKIKNKIENIDEYETIYVGYPNWWGEMPMILYTFFEDYDLSNKTITLFCTSGESGLSDTEKTIQVLEPSAPMVKGLYVSKSASKEATGDVKEWVNEIK